MPTRSPTHPAPLVSCIMPTGDRPEFAAQAIRCFRAQDYPARELIIVDDGRTPPDPDSLGDPRICYLRLGERASTGAKRNLACRAARGEIIIQWDDDDWHGPARIRRQIEPLCAGQAEITLLVDPLVLDLPSLELWQPDPRLGVPTEFSGGHCGTLAYRRIVCERFTCYPDCSTGEDAAFLRPALAAGLRLARLPGGEDFVYVRHGRNASQLGTDWHRRGARQVSPPARLAAELPNYRRLQAAASASEPNPRNGSASSRRLVRESHQAVGAGIHRSGWSYAFAGLERLDLPLWLDDFVEQSFCHSAQRAVRREPWVGIFHLPPSLPPFAPRSEHPQIYLASAEFRASLPALRGAVALSEYHANWLADRLQKPVLAVKHPSEPGRPWSPEHFQAASQVKLLQVGFYLRNTQAIEQIPPADRFQRARLLPHAARQGILDWQGRVTNHWARMATRPTWPGVVDVPCAANAEFDDLMATSIVLSEVFDASANNVVVECISRGTPLVVNRHPAVVEYVGEDYPLLFDSIQQVPLLLQDESRILAAHHHFLARRGPWLETATFAAAIGKFCRQVAEVS